jgi:hypothetical protein
MDLEGELERLSKEARKKLDDERAATEREAEELRRAAGVDDAAARDARRLAARPEGPVSLGGKVATIIVGLLGAWILWRWVVAPLLGLAVFVGVIALVVWVLVSLLGGDDDDEGGGPKGVGGAA